MKPSYLTDDAGNPSSTRLAMVLAIAIVMVVWAVVSLCAHRLQEIPESVVTLLGILMGAKAAQKWREAIAEVSPSEDPKPGGPSSDLSDRSDRSDRSDKPAGSVGASTPNATQP